VREKQRERERERVREMERVIFVTLLGVPGSGYPPERERE
jgi:hypothetical protein